MRILCFGDSNTWGYIPLNDGKRTPNRWTRVLASMLPDDEVIEEGLNSRTMYTLDPIEPWKRGFDYLLPCMQTHDQFDVFVLMLGTNDLKNRFNNTAEDIFKQFKDFSNFILNFNSKYEGNIRLIVSGIPPVNDKISYFGDDYDNTTPKRNEYNKLVAKYCYENNIEYIDNSDLEVGLDGVHLTEESHLKLALKLYSTIKGE